MKKIIIAALALTLLGGTAASARTVVRIGGGGIGIHESHRHWHPHYRHHYDHGYRHH